MFCGLRQEIPFPMNKVSFCSTKSQNLHRFCIFFTRAMFWHRLLENCNDDNIFLKHKNNIQLRSNLWKLFYHNHKKNIKRKLNSEILEKVSFYFTKSGILVENWYSFQQCDWFYMFQHVIVVEGWNTIFWNLFCDK